MRSTGWAVGKVCKAQELLSQASDELIAARLNLISLSDIDGADFRETDLSKRMDEFAGQLTDRFYDLDQIVRAVAELIPDREEES